EAIAAYNTAIELQPDFAKAHSNLGYALLHSGDFLNGWREYEWRWHGGTKRLKSRGLTKPQWRGEDISGRTILLYAEQGLGDTIQFCRYAALVTARGARVIMEVPPPLLQVLSGLHGVDRLVTTGDPLPDFDFHCPLLSLPLAFGTQVETIPAPIPYLFAKPEQTAYWRNRLGPKIQPRVGLVWNGGFRSNQPELWALNERRNIPVQLISRLNVPYIDFVSLQKGEPAESEMLALQAELWPGGNFHNPATELRDFEDTAGLIENLDLVISVDTSTAHLAGAMGKPVWLLNRFDTCWRWLEHRDDSPWYPTVRLFRQTEHGEWDGVIQRVAGALAEKFAPQSSGSKNIKNPNSIIAPLQVA
uniref:tetratricopeptide repeat protein n=1 Tax=Acidocella sp. TaxID=50710 RepID=UPI002615BD4D